LDKPLVTVITVTYNSARFVRDAIESVLSQEYDRIEYIIGDDCSTDETWEIIQEYRDLRIKSYRNEQNLGEYPNRNKAIDMASGLYLIFIDGDDIIFPHGIGFFVQMMEAFPQAAMAIQKNYQSNMLFPALFSPEETLRNHFYGKSNLLASSFASDFFRTSILKRWKLSTQYITGDEEIRLKMAAHYPILFVAGWVSWPRETPGQASSKIDSIKGMTEIYQYTNNILKMTNNEINQELRRDMGNAIKKRLARFAVFLILRGKLQEAGRLLHSTGFTWGNVKQFYNYKLIYNDALTGYGSTNPFRKGFLNKLQSS
jgi:glycosyltransferase involved in cell wall biosynthesis